MLFLKRYCILSTNWNICHSSMTKKEIIQIFFLCLEYEWKTTPVVAFSRRCAASTTDVTHVIDGATDTHATLPTSRTDPAAHFQSFLPLLCCHLGPAPALWDLVVFMWPHQLAVDGGRASRDQGATVAAFCLQKIPQNWFKNCPSDSGQNASKLAVTSSAALAAFKRTLKVRGC